MCASDVCGEPVLSYVRSSMCGWDTSESYECESTDMFRNGAPLSRTKRRAHVPLAAVMGSESTLEAIESLFVDATPIDQDDGPVPVVKIDYAPAFSRVMGFFRRVLVDGEHSARALLLSAGERKQARVRLCVSAYLPLCASFLAPQPSSSTMRPTTRLGSSVVGASVSCTRARGRRRRGRRRGVRSCSTARSSA